MGSLIRMRHLRHFYPASQGHEMGSAASLSLRCLTWDAAEVHRRRHGWVLCSAYSQVHTLCVPFFLMLRLLTKGSSAVLLGSLLTWDCKDVTLDSLSLYCTQAAMLLGD